MAHGTRTGNMLQYMLQQRHDERGAWAARTSWNCRLQKAQLNTAACSPYFGCNGPCDAPTSRMKVPSGAGSRSACGRICWQHTGRRDDGRAHACEGAHAAAARGTPHRTAAKCHRFEFLPDRVLFEPLFDLLFEVSHYLMTLLFETSNNSCPNDRKDLLFERRSNNGTCYLTQITVI
mgnify:CR=1 FL=1